MCKNCLPQLQESGCVHSEDRGSHAVDHSQSCPHLISRTARRDICFSSKGLLHTNPGDDTSKFSSMFHRQSLLQGEGTLAPHTGPSSSHSHEPMVAGALSEDEPHPLLLHEQF